MNSLDAAYEEQVQAALEASKREAMMANGQEESDADEGSRVVIEDEEPTDPEENLVRKGKRKREDDESGRSVLIVSAVSDEE